MKLYSALNIIVLKNTDVYEIFSIWEEYIKLDLEDKAVQVLCESCKKTRMYIAPSDIKKVSSKEYMKKIIQIMGHYCIGQTYPYLKQMGLKYEAVERISENINNIDVRDMLQYINTIEECGLIEKVKKTWPVKLSDIEDMIFIDVLVKIYDEEAVYARICAEGEECKSLIKQREENEIKSRLQLLNRADLKEQLGEEKVKELQSLVLQDAEKKS